MPTFDERPTRRRYARIERERRFALAELPPSVDTSDYQRLRDCYVDGTTLRVRKVESPAGDVLVVKLGQKTLDPEAPEDSRRRAMTTIYLSQQDAEALVCLRGKRSVKRRYYLRENGHVFAIDVYEEPPSARGTILAEVECEDDATLDAVRQPPWAIREVTDDPRLSGASLAAHRDTRPDRTNSPDEHGDGNDIDG